MAAFGSRGERKIFMTSVPWGASNKSERVMACEGQHVFRRCAGRAHRQQQLRVQVCVEIVNSSDCAPLSWRRATL